MCCLYVLAILNNAAMNMGMRKQILNLFCITHVFETVEFIQGKCP